MGEECALFQAFILINAEVGSEGQLLEELKKLPFVKDAYAIYGVYDIIVKIEAETMEKLKVLISTRIRRLNKVRSTLTMIVH